MERSAEPGGYPRTDPGQLASRLIRRGAAGRARIEDSTLHAYVVISLLTGARTEELRALTWERVDLDGRADEDPPVPPSIMVWHSVREGGDTKTRKSSRTLALPRRCVLALRRQRELQDQDKETAGRTWKDHGLVFASAVGTPLNAANVRRGFRRIVKVAGLDPTAWTPRELRHSFVSLLSDGGLSINDIADLCGHSGTSVTEKVYRHQLRPVLLVGAEAMDRIFGDPGQSSGSVVTQLVTHETERP